MVVKLDGEKLHELNTPVRHRGEEGTYITEGNLDKETPWECITQATKIQSDGAPGGQQVDGVKAIVVPLFRPQDGGPRMVFMACIDTRYARDPGMIHHQILLCYNSPPGNEEEPGGSIWDDMEAHVKDKWVAADIQQGRLWTDQTTRSVESVPGMGRVAYYMKAMKLSGEYPPRARKGARGDWMPMEQAREIFRKMPQGVARQIMDLSMQM